MNDDIPYPATTRTKFDRREKEQMYSWREAGQTLEQIGQHYGVSRERIRVCLKEHTEWLRLMAKRLYGKAK